MRWREGTWRGRERKEGKKHGGEKREEKGGERVKRFREWGGRKTIKRDERE